MLASTFSAGAMAAARYSVVLAFATIVLCQLLPGLAADALSFTVLSWNVHWQCGSDHLPGCRAAATQRFVDLSKQHSANVVVAVELEHNASAPIDLPSHGLTAHGWTQVMNHRDGAVLPSPPPHPDGTIVSSGTPTRVPAEYHHIAHGCR